jgi:hypothetical protein
MRLATAGKLGIGFAPDDRVCFNRHSAALVAGDLVMIDVRATDTTHSVTTEYGLDNSKYTNVISPATGAAYEDQYAFFGVVIRGGAVDSEVLVRFNGRVSVNMTEDDGTAGSSALGEPYHADLTDKEAHLTAGTLALGVKLLGVCNEVIAQGATAIAECDHFGISGIGRT